MEIIDMILYPAQLTRYVTSGQTPHLLDNGIYTTGNQIMDSVFFRAFREISSP